MSASRTRYRLYDPLLSRSIAFACVVASGIAGCRVGYNPVPSQLSLSADAGVNGGGGANQGPGVIQQAAGSGGAAGSSGADAAPVSGASGAVSSGSGATSGGGGATSGGAGGAGTSAGTSGAGGASGGLGTAGSGGSGGAAQTGGSASGGCPSTPDADGDGIGDACDACPNDYFNDLDHDGICGDVDPCAVDGLTAFPAATLFPFDLVITNLDLARQGAVDSNVAPGQKIDLTFSYKINSEPTCYCPTCLQQVVVGWPNDTSDPCSSVLRSCPGASGTSRVSLIAPSAPGTYYISTNSDFQYSCLPLGASASPAAFVGAICVR